MQCVGGALARVICAEVGAPPGVKCVRGGELPPYNILKKFILKEIVRYTQCCLPDPAPPPMHFTPRGAQS